MSHRRLATIWLAVLVCALSACTVTYAPVIDKYGADYKRGPVTRGVHVVREGETLYSIAWRYGWDFKALASANRIGAPYTIYPGQEIRLDRPASTTVASTTPRPAPKPAPSSGTTSTSKPSTSKPSKPTASAPAPKPATTAPTGPINWQWPATGSILSHYSANKVGQHGITLGGREGDPVAAAADGVVVYRGNGLTGYGNLLIIKHDERWLSAYAHNQSMVVSEGQKVKRGEKIATIGATGTFRTQLHFEIRRDGTPIDPVSVLPRR